MGDKQMGNLRMVEKMLLDGTDAVPHWNRLAGLGGVMWAIEQIELLERENSRLKTELELLGHKTKWLEDVE